MKYKIEILKSRWGKWYYNLVGRNHKIASTSEQYTSKYNAKRAVCYLLNHDEKKNIHYIEVEDVIMQGKSILGGELDSIYLERKKKSKEV